MPDSIRPYIHRKVVVLPEGASALEAAKAMCSQGVGSVVVSDGEGHMVGIVTDRDLTCAIVAANFDAEIELSEIMTMHLETVSETASLEDVIDVMRRQGIRRVPVVRENRHKKGQRCVGLISLDDLIAARVIRMEDVSAIVRAQIFRRQKALPEWKGRDLHSEPASDEFLHDLEQQMQVSEPAARAYASLILGLIVRRLHFTSAAHFIAHMPASLRNELMDLPAGPDHSITADAILKEVSSRFDLDRKSAGERLHQFWTALALAIHQPYEMGHIDDELPEDIRGLFSGLPKGQEPVAAESTEAPRSPQPKA